LIMPEICIRAAPRGVTRCLDHVTTIASSPCIVMEVTANGTRISPERARVDAQGRWSSRRRVPMH
jgi:hypothetical protein